MTDLITLSGAAVAAVSPYLAKIVDGAAEKVGEDAFEAAGKLVGWLRAKLSPAGKEALDDLANQPSDTLTQDILLAASAPKIQQTLTVDGEGAKGAQVAATTTASA